MSHEYNGDTVETQLLPAVIATIAHIVTVSGASYNPCGHMLLNLGGRDGWYFHVADLGYRYPRFMGRAGYGRYMRENRKTEWAALAVRVRSPSAMREELYRIMYKRWAYDLTRNNCVHFVDRVAQSGGLDIFGYCPREFVVTYSSP